MSYTKHCYGEHLTCNILYQMQLCTDELNSIVHINELSFPSLLAVKSFVELVRFLFTVPGVKFFLSRRICQDPIEKFFGCQRQRGRTHDNPNAQEFLKNTQALRVVNGFCRDVAKGNCRGNKETKLGTKENTPLVKRKQKRNRKEPPK